MKKRNIALSIIFSIITVGIYLIYWYLSLNQAMIDLTPEDDYKTSGLKVFIFTLITGGIYGWYWAYQMGQKMNILKKDNSFHVLFLILEILQLGIVNIALIQHEINKRVGA
jgi:H+/Cl- antiporter ClcA